MEEANAVLRNGIKRTNIPEPDVNLNRIVPIRMPKEWSCMTALQKELWQKRAREVLAERASARRKRAAKRGPGT